MKRVLLVFFVSVLAACSASTSQDPMKDYGSKFKDIQPPKPRPPNEKPIESHNLLIDAPQAVGFNEQQESSFTIAGRILLPGYDKVDLVLENLSEFHGATFDNGTFKWTPPTGTTGTIAVRDMVLHVRVIAYSTTDNTLISLTHSSDVLVKVNKIPGIPVIRQVQGLPPFMYEGDRETIHVLVEDVDGGVTQPVLQVTAPASSYTKSLAPFLDKPDVQFDPKTQLWDFEFDMSLPDEVVSDSASYSLTFTAVTSFGRSSPSVEPGAVKVFTQLKDPWSSWKSAQDFVAKAGVESRFPIAIQNPQGEGRLALIKPTFPSGARFDCGRTRFPVREGFACDLVYTPDVTHDPIRFETVKFTVETTNSDLSDPQVLDTDFTMNIKVVAP